MKKKLSLLLAFVFAFALILTSCGGGASNNQAATTETKTETAEKTETAKEETKTEAPKEEAKEEAAADSTSTDKYEPYTVNAWLFPLGGDERAAEERALYDGMIADFKTEFPTLDVSMQLVPWDNRETKMMTAIAANKGPDCVYLNPDILKLFQFNGVLVSMDDYVGDDVRSEIEPAILNNAIIDGKLYGIPCLIDIGVPAYNMDLLAKVGVTTFEQLPTTWDQYDELLGKLNDAGIPGVYFQYATGPISSYANAMWFSYGCDVIEPNGTVVIDNEPGLKVLNMMVDWYKKGYTPTDSVSVFDQDAAFLSGKVATTLSPDGTGFFVRKAPQAEFNLMAGPVLSGPAGRFTMSTCASIGITVSCKNVPATAEWVKFFTNKKNNDAWMAFGGYVPARKGAVNPHPEIDGLKIAYESLDAVRGEPNHAAARTIGPVFISNIQAMCSGSVTFDQGVADMKKGFEDIVTGLNAIKPQ